MVGEGTMPPTHPPTGRTVAWGKPHFLLHTGEHPWFSHTTGMEIAAGILETKTLPLSLPLALL